MWPTLWQHLNDGDACSEEGEAKGEHINIVNFNDLNKIAISN